MIMVYKLLFYDEQNTLRRDPSYYLRSAAINLPDWMVIWYKAGETTQMPYPYLPLWACKDVAIAVEMMRYTRKDRGHYEVWECEEVRYTGILFLLSYTGIEYLKRNYDKYSPEAIIEAERVGEMGTRTGIVMCESLKLIRRIK